MLAKQAYRQHDEVVEVHRVAGQQLLLVLRVEPGLCLQGRSIGDRKRGLGIDEIIFPATDLVHGLLYRVVILLVPMRQPVETGFDIA